MKRRKHASLREWYTRTRMRLGNEYTQGEAAELLGVSQAYFSMLLAGKRIPSRDKAIEIAAKTGVPAEVLLKLEQAA